MQTSCLVFSFRRLSLATRLTILAIATLLPIAALTVLSYFEQRDDQRREEVRAATSYARSLAAGLDNYARDLDSMTRVAALALARQEGPINNANTQPFLRALLERHEIYRAVFVTDTSGRILAQDNGDDTGLDVSDRPYIQALMSGEESVWTGGLDGIRTGQLTVAFARVVQDGRGETLAYLVVAFYPVNLAERIPPVDADEHIVLVDKDAQVLFSSQDPQLDEIETDLRDSANVSAALSGETVELERHQTRLNNDKRFGTYVPIPNMDWALLYTRPQARLESTLAADLQRNLAVLAGIGALTIGALIVVSKQVTRPLAELSTAVTRMKDNEPPAAMKLTSEPDISRLQQSFMEMAHAVRAREAELASQTEVLDTLHRVGESLASSLDLEETVQAVVDAGTHLTEAAFGAFFYNGRREDGEIYQLYVLSGAEREDFADFEMPRPTALFGPTFRGEGVVRIADVLEDARYGTMPPHHGMPKGHLPVRSYLAVPVASASGQVVGGLFFAHPEPGVFSERHEQLATGIAAWAAIAFDNARLYQESQRVQDELLAANRAKDEFLSLVSHELRTPITIISLGASRLLRMADRLEEEEQLSVLEDVRNNAARLAELVQNLLILASPGPPSQAGGWEPVLARVVANDVCQQFQQRRPARQVRFECRNPDAMVSGSRLYIEQVLINLLSNADKYSPAEAPITVVLATSGDEALLSVEDRGPGLDEEDVGHLFEPYYRGEQARTKANGFGLGLAVCKRLVQEMQGELVYENAAPVGAKFTLRLPLLADSDTGDEQSEADPEPVAVPG